MKKVFVLLVLLVFVFGCSGIPGWGGSNNNNKDSRKGFGGSSGLSISFVEDKPPKETSHGKNIPFSLNVRNNGLFTIPAGGFMARVVGLDTNFNPFELQGMSSETMGQVDESGIGGEVDVELGSASYNPEQMFDNRVIKSGELQVEVCYPYGTLVVIDEFWIGSKTSDVSKGSASSGSNSNAPVQVTDLEEKGGGTSTDFTFKIKVADNKGSVVPSCFPSEEEKDEMNVELEILSRDVSCYYELNGEKKEIGSGGTVTLNSQKEKVLHCTIPFSSEKPVKTQMQMRLNYNYFDKIDVPAITIRRL